MSEAAVEKAPVKAKKSPFGPKKAPESIIFRLLQKNEKTRPDTPEYPPYILIPNTDVISWIDEEGHSYDRAIRYLRGYQSIFVDEQEKGGRVVPEAVLNNPQNHFEIIDGEIKCRPSEKAKIQWWEITNWNEESKHRTGTKKALVAKYSEEQNVITLAAKQKKQQEAITKAFSANESQLAFHCRYLDIPIFDHKTNSTREYEAVVADYRQRAIDDPVSFLDTFDDENLKLKYYIQKAVDENVISLKMIPDKACWVSSKEEVCDIVSGLAPIESIFNFLQLKAGEGALKRILDLNK